MKLHEIASNYVELRNFHEIVLNQDKFTEIYRNIKKYKEIYRNIKKYKEIPKIL